MSKVFQAYFIQSIALQFLKSVPEVGCYCRSKPEIMLKEGMCRGKRCLGKAGTTPVRTQPLEGANIASLPGTHHPGENLPQSSHPKKPTPVGRKDTAWHPWEEPWLPGAWPPQKGINYSATKDHSQFRMSVGSTGAKPSGMPTCPPPPPAAGPDVVSAWLKAF